MVHTEATYRAWMTLHGSWQAANYLGREARAAATRKLRAAVEGAGQPPSADELQEVQRLEDQADGMGQTLGRWIDDSRSQAREPAAGRKEPGP